MRRFHQLALLTVALFSLLAFLVYKHEYDRLRNILQVLNTFGNPASTRTTIANNKFNWNGDTTYNFISTTTGSWRQLDDGIHVLQSAFLNSGQSIVIHGVIKQRNSPVQIPWTHCQLHSDESGKVTVPLTTEIEIPEVTWSPFTLTCNLHATPKKFIPIGVSVFSEESPMTPMIEIVNRGSDLKAKNSEVAICGSTFNVRGGVIDESIIVQFLEYHRFVGIKRFVIYSDQLLPAIRRRIQTTSLKYPDLFVEIIVCNTPSTASSTDRSFLEASTSIVMKSDCLERLRAGHKYVIFLELTELIVSRYHSRLASFVEDEANNVVEGSLGGLQFVRKIFCTEFNSDAIMSETEQFLVRYKNDLLVSPPMFSKTQWIDSVRPNNRTYLLETSALKTFTGTSDGIVPILNKGTNLLIVSDDFASVHAYVRCGDTNVEKLAGHANTDDIVVKKIRGQLV